MAVEKVCPTCGKEFMSPYRQVQYCSVSCGRVPRIVQTPEDIRSYLLERVDIPEDPNACWIWKGSFDDHGYGMMFVRKGSFRAHRISHELFIGPIPEGMYILHACDTPACVSPRHLRYGTKRENANDRVVHGRQVRGSQHRSTHLTETDVENILQLFHLQSYTQKSLAELYQVNFVTIHDIIYRETWTHVLPGLYPAPKKDGRTVVTADDVRAMRILYDSGTSANVIAKRFNVHTTQAWKICKRKSWKQIP